MRTPLLIVFCTLLSFSCSLKINVFRIIIGDTVLNGKSVIAAAHDVAFERVAKMYPRVRQAMARVSNDMPGSFSCPAAGDEMVILASSLYFSQASAMDRDAINVFLSPGCSLEVISLGDTGREANALILASTATDPRLANKRRFPTTISAGPSGYLEIATAIVDLMDKFKWTKIAIICDTRSQDPVLSVGITQFCAQGRMVFDQIKTRIQTKVITIDSTSANENYRSKITEARQFTSIILLVSIGDIQKILLAEAAKLGMGNGKYVFLAFRLTELPDQDIILNSNDTLTETMMPVLPYVIKFESKVPDTSKFDGDWEAIVARTRNEYGKVVPPRLQFNRLQITAYQTIIMLAQVLDKNWEALENKTARDLTNLFFNSTFHHSAERIRLSSTGMRITDIIITRYQNSSNKFEPVWTYDFFLKSLTGPYNLSDWEGFPVSSEAPCEPDNYACQDHDDGTQYFPLIAIPLVLIVVLTSTIFLLKKNGKGFDTSWWLVDTTELAVTKSEDDGFLVISGQSIDLANQGICWQTEEGVYRSKKVEIVKTGIPTDLESFTSRAKAVQALKNVKHLEHHNIASLIGVGFVLPGSLKQQLYFVTRGGDKGTLRGLIDNDGLSFNWDLRFSLIWDLLNALTYLRTSMIKEHGFINSFSTLIIDEHFTLKLARTGLWHVYSATLGSKNESSFFNPFPLAAALWMAPEVVPDNGQVSPLNITSAADIYSFGVVLYEMGTRSLPFDCDIGNQENLRGILELRKQSLKVSQIMNSMEAAPSLVLLAQDCLNFHPPARPKLDSIVKLMNKECPQRHSNFTEALMKRLEKYQEDLENLVAARTESLRAEQKKADELLSNLLPKTIAQKLRNKEETLPQSYDCVTIMFSDIPAFNDLVAICTPFDVFSLLNQLFAILDEQLTMHDVYKVETIRDSYMVASGLPERNGNRHAAEMANAALSFNAAVSQVTDPTNGSALTIRIGLNSGPCVAAVIGVKLPHYCIVGDTVNTASRMESHGLESRIHMSGSTEKLLSVTGLYDIECRGLIPIKGKGEQTTYWLNGWRSVLAGQQHPG